MCPVYTDKQKESTPARQARKTAAEKHQLASQRLRKTTPARHLPTVPPTPYPQRAAALSSLSRASTQRAPSGVSSHFQNGARVFR